MNARLIVLALLIGCFLMGFAADVSAQAASKPAPAGGPREGIKVHGDWVIEVRNPDGSLATRREFKNALEGGGETLARVLSRAGSVGLWTVDLGTNSGSGPCLGRQLGISDCTITEYELASYPFGFFGGLTVTTGSSNSLVLSGTAKPSTGATIHRVATNLFLCPPSAAPSWTCGGGFDGGDFGGMFTQAVLNGAPGTPNAPVSVGQGQFIQVTVTISFS